MDFWQEARLALPAWQRGPNSRRSALFTPCSEGRLTPMWRMSSRAVQETAKLSMALVHAGPT